MHSLDDKIINILDILNTNNNKINNKCAEDNGNINNIKNPFIKAQKNI